MIKLENLIFCLCGERCNRLNTSWHTMNREYWMIYRGPGFLAVCLFLSLPTVSPVELTDERGGSGWARSHFREPRESLVLYKSFSNLWLNGHAEVLLVQVIFKTLILFFHRKKISRLLSLKFDVKPLALGICVMEESWLKFCWVYVELVTRWPTIVKTLTLSC